MAITFHKKVEQEISKIVILPKEGNANGIAHFFSDKGYLAIRHTLMKEHGPFSLAFES